MRKLSFNLILLILVLSSFGLCYASPILTIESATILQGQTTTIDVILSYVPTPPSAADAVTAFDFKIPYNTSALSVSNLVAGASLSGIGGTFSATTPSSGLMSFIYYDLSTPEIINGGVLASFDITGLTVGSYLLNFSSMNLGNLNSEDILNFQTVAGTINVVPIPPAVLLLGGGLATLLALRRRRS